MLNWCCGRHSRKMPEDPVVLAIQANDFKAFESAYQSAQTTDQARWSTANKIPNRNRTLRAIEYLKIALKIKKCDPKIVVALLKDGALLSSPDSRTPITTSPITTSPITSRRALSDVSPILPEQHQETLHYLLTYGASLTTVNENMRETFPHQHLRDDQNLWIFAALNGILIKSIEHHAFLTDLFEVQKNISTAHIPIAVMAIDALTQLNTPLDDTYQQHHFKRHHQTFREEMNALATQHAQLPETSTQESDADSDADSDAERKVVIINEALQSLRDEHLRLSSIDPESADTTQRARDPNSSTSSIKFNTLHSNAPVKTNYTNEFTSCCLAQGRPLA